MSAGEKENRLILIAIADLLDVAIFDEDFAPVWDAVSELKANNE